MSERRGGDGSRASLFQSFWVPASAGAGAVALFLVAPDRKVAALLLLLPALYFGLSSPDALRRVLLAVVVLETPIQFDRYIGNNLADASLGALSGFNISLTTFAIVGLYWLWGLQRMSGGAPAQRPLRVVGPAPFLYTLVVVASMAWALDPLVAGYEVVILIQAVAVFVYVGATTRTEQDVLFLLRLLAVAVLVQVLFIGVLLLGPSLVQIGPVKIQREGARIAGTLGGPNSFGAFMAMVVPVMLALAVGARDAFDRRLGLVALLGGLVAMIMSGSRGAWAGALVGLGFAVVTGVRRGWINRSAIAKIAVAAMVPAILLQSVLATRLSELNNAATQSRIPLMRLALSMIRARPLSGVGANNFSIALPQFLDSDYGQAWISTVHNKYLLVFSETGIFGLIFFVWTLVSVVGLAISLSREKDVFLAAVAVGLGSAITANMVHMLADIFHDRVMTVTLWLVMGMLVGLHRVARSRRMLTHPATSDDSR